MSEHRGNSHGVGDTGPLRIGQHLGRYAIQALLGRGGHAFVYRAFDELFERHVALKMLHSDKGVSAEMFGRGVDEARMLAKFEHPNIVKIHDVNITPEGKLYLVMELLEGRTLLEVLKERTRLTIEEALRVFVKIAEGVDSAHQRGVIHRDLKPANIYVLAGNDVRVLDFGVAKLLGSDARTQRNVVLGTASYMSPQQGKGHAATVQSDVYGLGVMLWEALAGFHPLRLKNVPLGTFGEVMEAMASLDPPLLSDIDPDIPLPIARMVNRALAPQLGQRYPTVRAFIHELQTSLERHVREERQIGRVSRYSDVSKPLSALPVVTAKVGVELKQHSPLAGGDVVFAAREQQLVTAPLEPAAQRQRARPAAFVPMALATTARDDSQLGPQGTVRLKPVDAVEPQRAARQRVAIEQQGAPRPFVSAQPVIALEAPVGDSGIRQVGADANAASTPQLLEAPNNSAPEPTPSVKSGERHQTLERPVVLRIVLFGGLVGLTAGVLAFVGYGLLVRSVPVPDPAPSGIVIESVRQVQPQEIPSAESAPPPPSATVPGAQSQHLDQAPPLPVSAPARAERPAATVASAAPPLQAPPPIQIPPSPASTSRSAKKDKWDGRMEMFDEASGAKTPSKNAPTAGTKESSL